MQKRGSVRFLSEYDRKRLSLSHRQLEPDSGKIVRQNKKISRILGFADCGLRRSFPPETSTVSVSPETSTGRNVRHDSASPLGH